LTTLFSKLVPADEPVTEIPGSQSAPEKLRTVLLVTAVPVAPCTTTGLPYPWTSFVVTTAPVAPSSTTTPCSMYESRTVVAEAPPVTMTELGLPVLKAFSRSTFAIVSSEPPETVTAADVPE
jgi:hypothetical protein